MMAITISTTYSLPPTSYLPTIPNHDNEQPTDKLKKEGRDLSPVYDTPCYLFIYYIIISTCMP